MVYDQIPLAQANRFLLNNHYLGKTRVGKFALGQFDESDQLVATQVWKAPSSRNLPLDGTWLELCRWCLTPEAGPNAGSRQHAHAIRWIKQNFPDVTTLISYSDPDQNHTGSLYKACNWFWAPTWHRLRPPPTGNGSWGTDRKHSVKDRWVFPLKDDGRRDEILRVKDGAGQRTLDELVALRMAGVRLDKLALIV